MKTVVYTAEADRFLAHQSPEIAERIETKIEDYALTGHGDVKAMKGSPTLRLRVGNYRVIFTEDMTVLEVFDIGHRREIYR